MSVREIFPKPQLPRSHYFLTFSRGEKSSTFAVPAGGLYASLAIVPLLAAWLAASTIYVVFHDELLAGLMSRQSNAQFAYEDRLATMRAELERVSSHQLLEQDTVANKLADISARQSLLEGRASMIASLAEIAAGPAHSPAMAKSASPARVAAPIAKTAGGEPPGSALGFAPVSPRAEFPALTGAKPRPETIEPAAKTDASQPERSQRSSQIDVSPVRRLSNIAMSLDALEFNQVKTLALMQSPIVARSARMRSALGEAGLAPEKLLLPQGSAATGGPFIPLKVDPSRSPFDREYANLQDAIVGFEKLRRLLPHLPLRGPLNGNPDMTSSFGVRMDPFLGRPAMHAGIDFREDYGTPVHATAAGKVVSAGPSGGYGNMVEIDHGNGLSTRYGHMSAILVSEGDAVGAGGVIGKLGSTGRSTGPHLHYETRVDDEAVDPLRFLRAGKSLFGEN